MFGLEEFVIYTSFSELILLMHLNYICICIDMFVRHITVYKLICVCMLYKKNLVVLHFGYSSCISPMCGLFFHCIFVKFTFISISL